MARLSCQSASRRERQRCLNGVYTSIMQAPHGRRTDTSQTPHTHLTSIFRSVFCLRKTIQHASGVRLTTRRTSRTSLPKTRRICTRGARQYSNALKTRLPCRTSSAGTAQTFWLSLSPSVRDRKLGRQTASYECASFARPRGKPSRIQSVAPPSLASPAVIVGLALRETLRHAADQLLQAT